MDPYRVLGDAGWGFVRRVGKGQAGRLLDGRTWDQFPDQFPGVG